MAWKNIIDNAIHGQPSSVSLLAAEYDFLSKHVMTGSFVSINVVVSDSQEVKLEQIKSEINNNTHSTYTCYNEINPSTCDNGHADCIDNAQLDVLYSCDKCNKQYIHASHLERHKRIHTMRKAHRCNMCDTHDKQPNHKGVYIKKKPHKLNPVHADSNTRKQKRMKDENKTLKKRLSHFDNTTRNLDKRKHIHPTKAQKQKLITAGVSHKQKNSQIDINPSHHNLIQSDINDHKKQCTQPSDILYKKEHNTVHTVSNTQKQKRMHHENKTSKKRPLHVENMSRKLDKRKHMHPAKAQKQKLINAGAAHKEKNAQVDIKPVHADSNTRKQKRVHDENKTSNKILLLVDNMTSNLDKQKHIHPSKAQKRKLITAGVSLKQKNSQVDIKPSHHNLIQSDINDHKKTCVQPSNTFYKREHAQPDVKLRVERVRGKNKPHKLENNDADPKPHACDLCDKQYIHLGNLERHKRVHSKHKPHICHVCRQGFGSIGHLNRHTFSHTGEKPYACKKCPKRFALFGILKRHQLVHSDKKPYVCKLCKNRFKHSDSLKKHLVIHYGIKASVRHFTGECDQKRPQENKKFKPYSCDHCDKKFSQKCGMYRHQLIHKGVKPFSCKICNQKFTRAWSLDRHTLVHTGKPFKCETCKKRFTRKIQVTHHEKRYH